MEGQGVVEGQGHRTLILGLLAAGLAGLVLVSLGVSQAFAASATYYVCNDSSCPNAADTNSGSQEHPWKTIGRVNQQTLNPGDSVLLKGGDTFTDHTLEPPSSGSTASPVVYGSYGTGHATLTMGVWIASHRSRITIEKLTVDGSEHGGAKKTGIQGIAGAAAGYDEHISILNNTLQNLSIAINGGEQTDGNWVISGNVINGTGGSGIEAGGESFTIQENTIENTGLDAASYSYGVHGIYLRASNSKVLHNTITNFSDSGVTVRYRNSVVENNTISKGTIGISWFQYDSTAGTSTWSNNTISHTAESDIYVSRENEGLKTSESFVITNNKLSKDAGVDMQLDETTGSYTVTGNTPCNVTPPGFCGTPTAITGSATSLTETGVTLNGTVNPEGKETTYHFEYGKTTSYGTSVPVPSANVGSGLSNLEESKAITGLERETTYHFRLVATNTFGTTYGEDHTFTTISLPSSSRWMAYDRNTGRIMVYYQGSNGQIDAWNYENGVGWTWGEHAGHAAATGTSPTMLYNPETGRIMVYYQGSNGQIDAWNYENGVGWVWGEHGGHAAAAGTSPTMAYDPSTGRIMVYYQGSNGQIDAWNYENSSGWTWSEHAGHAAATGTSPTMAYDPSTGRIMVYYQGSNGQIDVWNYENGVGWTWGEHGGHAAATGTSPTLVYNPETNRVMVYYQGSNGQIDAWNYENGVGWAWGEHAGHAAAAGTSPTMAYDPSTGRIMVYYRGSNGQIDAWNYENGVGWTWGEHGGHP
jgi:hypothetical protein